MKDESSDSSTVLIDLLHVATGVYLTRKNAKRVFTDAKFLYDNQQFQSAIPLFIISIEESLKAQELSIKFEKKQAITQKDWSNLQNHKYKLSHNYDFMIENIESANDQTTKEIARELGHKNMLQYKSDILDFLLVQKSHMSQFQFLKEKCLYQNWNKEFSEWDGFDYITSGQKEDLAYYIMKQAEIQLKLLELSIEMAVYVIRRDSFMIKDLEFPTYNELRHPQDFETKSAPNSIDDYFKYYRGLKIFESLIMKKSFAIIDQIITHELIRKCLKLIPTNNLDDWYPHPMIKSIYFAMAALREGSKDGNYTGYSDDADQTHDGKPMMYCASIINKNDKIAKIERIMINGNEYSINDKIIHQILKMELVIDTQIGKEISLEKTHLAYSKIGLKIRKLRDNEIKPAIDNAISMIDEGKMERITDKVKAQIKLTTKQNWNDQDVMIRSIIGSCFASNIVRDQNTLVMTGHYDPLEKFKVRGMILQILILRNDMNMNTDV